MALVFCTNHYAVKFAWIAVMIEFGSIAIIVAMVMNVFNVTLKPFLILITIPVTFLTFGLFLLVLYIAAAFIDGFDIDGFWWALLFSLVNSVLFGLGTQNRLWLYLTNSNKL